MYPDTLIPRVPHPRRVSGNIIIKYFFMSPWIFLLIVVVYFSALIVISFYTSRGADNASFFVGNRKSPWFLVAYGMIGATISGVTFISIPGEVGGSMFSYMQVVFGYFAGYMVIANVLLPLYYRMNLTSIYVYLDNRFGWHSYKTGAFYFLLSRVIGASFRLYIVAMVIDYLYPFPLWSSFLADCCHNHFPYLRLFIQRRHQNDSLY